MEIGLETLLDLDGTVFRLQQGYWVKFSARLVNQSTHIPHGISYSLTLHDRNNSRILGFDNAHACQPPRRKKFGGRKVTWDHKHRNEKIKEYEYDSASQLMEDFWAEVDRIVPRR
jgi:hypothetical protein